MHSDIEEAVINSAGNACQSLCRTYERNGEREEHVPFWNVEMTLQVCPEDEEIRIFNNVFRQMNAELDTYAQTPDTCISAAYPLVKIAVFHL